MRLNEILIQHRITQGEGRSAGPRASTPGSGPADHRIQDLETILSVTRKINTSLVLSDVLALVIGQAIRITEADRGILLLADQGGTLQYVIGRDKNGNVIHPDTFRVSDSVLEDVFTTGESICAENALNDERFELRQSIVNLELQTIMCAPLRTHEATIGVIYVDSRHIHSVNRDEILRLFEILAGQAAIAIQNARLYENLKRAYEDLREANDHIIKSERMVLRGEMAAEVSHELKNILSIAMLQTETLKRFVQQTDKSNSEKYAGEVLESIRRIQTFAENLLVSSRIKSELRPLQLNTLIPKFHTFVASLKKFRNGNIVLALDENLPEIQADRDQIHQVLLNLVNNAIEAFHEASIRIETTYDTVNKAVRLRVCDNGPGLDPEVRGKVFVEKVTTKPDGHGFGLPVCKRIMQNHNGTISVDSKPGEGTAFTITFPVQPRG